MDGVKEYLSYAQFIKDQQMYKRSGGPNSDGFNKFDTPSHKYFKLLFYFGDKTGELAQDGTSSGLLAPTWEVFSNENDNNPYYNYNSAWAYLKLNDEDERADKLETFVTLLSNISSYSPWYFTSVNGIQEALERKVTEDGKLDLNEPKKLTITCLPDAYDNRIGTLLELYRDITWSWTQKREIIPANLRKFDMGIFIFESPLHQYEEDATLSYAAEKSPSYKMIEFHDCEFNYNSIKSGWGELNNQTGMQPAYTIEISYNDCYEIAYNEFILRTIGDVIDADTKESQIIDHELISPGLLEVPEIKESAVSNSSKKYDNIKVEYSTSKPDYMSSITTFGNLEDRTGKGTGTSEKIIKTEYMPGFISNAVGQVAGHLKADVVSLMKRAFLGNIHTYSLSQIGSQMNIALQGNLITTGMTVSQYIRNAQQRAAAKAKEKPSGNIFKESISKNL